MTTLQIAWRFRRLVLQQLWRRQHRKAPTYHLNNLLSRSQQPFGYTPGIDFSPSILRKADALRSGEFTFLNQSIQFKNSFPDWSFSPDGDPLWTYNLHYFEYTYDLLWAFQLTKDSKYAKHLFALVDNWITENPFWNAIAWNPYPLSRRICVWSNLLQQLQHCSELQTNNLDRWVSSLCQQIEFLSNNLEYDVDNNHLITNARALVWAGLILENHPSARQWYQRGLQIMVHQAKRQVLADGGHWERSTSYQMVVLQDYLETLLLLEHCNKIIPPILHEVVSHMFDFLLHIIRPDGELPLLNDSIRDYPLKVKELFSVGAAYLQRSDLKCLRHDMGNLYLAWLLGSKGLSCYSRLPTSYMPTTSIALPESGYYVMRGITEDITSYLIFDCGPIGPSHSPAHAHADNLSFELTIGEQPIIVDPGVYEYQAGQWRKEFRSTRYHNTITVDGLDQSVLWGNFRVAEMAQPQLHLWNSTTQIVEVDGEHNGYGRLSSPVLHRRHIIQNNPLQWVITDILESQGEANHAYDIWFHLAPSQCTVDAKTKCCQARFAGYCDLNIALRKSDGIAVSVEEGWISNSWKQKEFAPVIRFSWSSSEKQMKLITVLSVVLHKPPMFLDRN